MPAPERFSFDRYDRDPTYAGVLEARLTTTAPPDAGGLALSAYTEATFPGYQRKSGPRGSLFFDPVVGTDTANLDGKMLSWTATGGFPVAIRAVLIVATLPGQDPQLVAVVPCEVTLTASDPTIAVSVSFATSRFVV